MSDAEVFIQWKGTDVCLDFYCPCRPDPDSHPMHFDGDFAYALRCPHCKTVYEMPTVFPVKPMSRYAGYRYEHAKEPEKGQA